MSQRITAAQLRGARGLLDWSLMDLARAADVSVAACHRAEGRHPGVVTPGTLGAIRVALETVGVTFAELEDGALVVTLSPR